MQLSIGQVYALALMLPDELVSNKAVAVFLVMLMVAIGAMGTQGFIAWCVHIDV